jgi:hypothetical protein
MPDEEIKIEQVNYLRQLAEERRRKWKAHEQVSTEKSLEQDLPKCTNSGNYL